MDLNTLLEFLKTVGPTAAMGIIAFYFFDKKDSRSNETIGKIVKAHNEALDKADKRMDKADIRMDKATVEFRAIVREEREHDSERNKSLVEAIDRITEENRCYYKGN